jgi:hypothetical protein
MRITGFPFFRRFFCDIARAAILVSNWAAAVVLLSLKYWMLWILFAVSKVVVDLK